MYLLLQIKSDNAKLHKSISENERVRFIKCNDEIYDAYLNAPIEFFADSSSDIWDMHMETPYKEICNDVMCPISIEKVPYNCPTIDWVVSPDHAIVRTMRVHCKDTGEYQRLYLGAGDNVIAKSNLPIDPSNLHLYTDPVYRKSNIFNLHQLYRFGMTVGLFHVKNNSITNGTIFIEKVNHSDYKVGYCRDPENFEVLDGFNWVNYKASSSTTSKMQKELAKIPFAPYRYVEIK